MSLVDIKTKAKKRRDEILKTYQLLPLSDIKYDQDVRQLFRSALKTLQEQRPSILIYFDELFMKGIEELFVLFMHEKHIADLILRIKNYDFITYLHSIDVFILGTLLSCAFDCDTLSFSKACLIHDGGKIKIPLSILNKNGKLTDEEYEIMKTHTIHSYELIKDFESEYISLVVLSHHEKGDGSGYPRGIQHEEEHFHFDYFIIGLVDEFSALTLPRSYKEGFDIEKTRRINFENLFRQINRSQACFRMPLEFITESNEKVVDYQYTILGKNFVKLIQRITEKKTISVIT